MNAKVNPSTTNQVKASFPVRRMDFEFKEVPRYWAAHDAGITHFMTALSALFPDGEKFFVDSVRAVRQHPKLSDLQMQKEISAFIGQEAMHSKEHVAFNASAQAYGYDVSRLEKMTDTVIKTSVNTVLKLFKPFGFTRETVGLTGTCALEHFTATIAAELLTNPNIQQVFEDDTMYRLWMWHAVEENEHKSVVFDVYQTLYGTGIKAYGQRAIAMALAMVILFFVQSYFTALLLKQDNKLTFKDSKRMIKFMYGRQGFITRQIPELLAFFRPNFHPNDFDTDALLSSWKQKLGFTSH